MKPALKDLSNKGIIKSALLAYRPDNERTAAAYKYFLTEYLEFADKAGLEPIQPGTLQAYIEGLKAAGKPARTINSKLYGCKAAIMFAVKMLGLQASKEAVIKTALNGIKGLKVGATAKTAKTARMLNESEFEQVLEKASPRNGLYIEFLFRTGCRVTEMLTVMKANIKQIDNLATFPVIGKGSKERIIKIPLELLNRINAVFKGKINLFETEAGKPLSREHVTTAIKATVLRVLGKTTSAHALRHSFATIMLHKTGKIKAVSEYLGHYSTATTLDIYTHEELSENDLFGPDNSKGQL